MAQVQTIEKSKLKPSRVHDYLYGKVLLYYWFLYKLYVLLLRFSSDSSISFLPFTFSEIFLNKLQTKTVYFSINLSYSVLINCLFCLINVKHL